MHRLTFRFSDGVERSVDAPATQPVLDAALQAGIPILNQCRSGSCATCVARLISGVADMTTSTTVSLLPGERAAGHRLTCQCYAGTDCVFEIDYSSTLGESQPLDYETNIVALDQLAANTVRLLLELPTEDCFEFEPGQFVQVRVPGTDQWRSYSMASTAKAMPRLELLVRLLDRGVMSDYLRHEAEIGDLVEIRGPYGSFRLRQCKAPHIFVAGGTGLAPMMSMLDTIKGWSGRKPPLLLIFGCADESGLFLLDELEIRAFWLPTLRVRVTVDRKLDAQSSTLIGTPVSVLGAGDATHPDTVAYLCGPPGMVAAAHERLLALGVQPANIYAEQFVASSDSAQPPPFSSSP